MLENLKTGDKIRMVKPHEGIGGNGEIGYVLLLEGGKVSWVAFGSNTFCCVDRDEECFEKVEET